jgi:type II secretory ATPase GspE/PulE/Tfp pilus assembly ATPase PilB-like protein
MRIIDDKQQILDLSKLGFADDVLGGFREAITASNGIILVTGPTGSGKSTTLYAALAEIISDKRNISTIEDPVEYNMRGVNQFQVNPKAGFTFATALRSLLRQDPDIIMVGEIRDAETAKLATEAALTGHLVLATLHTNDAPSAVVRLVNMGVEPYLVAASLRAVLAQRLIKRLCPHCRREARVEPDSVRMLQQAVGRDGELPAVYESPGCPQCQQNGYAGRTAIHELLPTDERMINGPGGLADLHQIRERGRRRGYRTLLEDGLAKVGAGQIGLDALFSAIARTPADTDDPEQSPPDA